MIIHSFVLKAIDRARHHSWTRLETIGERSGTIAIDRSIANMADTNRIAKELREIASDIASGVTVSPHGDSLTHMKGTIAGERERRG